MVARIILTFEYVIQNSKTQLDELVLWCSVALVIEYGKDRDICKNQTLRHFVIRYLTY